MGFADRLAEAVGRTVPGCVGLDPHLALLPEVLAGDLPPGGAERREAAAVAVEVFGRALVELVAGRVPVMKPQMAFFEALGAPGVAALERIVAHARDAGLLVLMDGKRGDIGSTAEAYAQAILDDGGPYAADAVTLSPFLGGESLQPFVDRCDRAGKGIFVLVRTSNPGAGAWQEPVAQQVASWVEAQSSARAGACGLGPIGAVVGATVRDEVARWRTAMPHAWLLAPGYGAQGAGVGDVRSHFLPDGTGALVTSSRGVLFPASGADPGEDWRAGIQKRLSAFLGDLALLR